MPAKYTRLGQLKGKFGVPAREYLTARDFGGNFTYESRSTCMSIVTYFLRSNTLFTMYGYFSRKKKRGRE